MSDEKTVGFRCKNCGHRFEEQFRGDEIIGPHREVKQNGGLPHRDPDDTVHRSPGYGTMPAIHCPKCGLVKHRVIG